MQSVWGSPRIGWKKICADFLTPTDSDRDSYEVKDIFFLHSFIIVANIYLLSPSTESNWC